MTRSEDQELVDAARAAIRAVYLPHWHVVGAAVRVKSGAIYPGVHLDGYFGRMAVCAEAVALGRAITDGERGNITAIVAVRQSGPDDTSPAIGAPCGACRELILDHAPDARILLADADGTIKGVSVHQLLPERMDKKIPLSPG